MTATEELRALLDEREVEWEAWNDCITAVPPSTHYLEVSSGTLCAVIVDATPAQAVEATLGRGTCEMEHVKDGPCYDVWRCSACGYEYAENVSMDSIVQNFCPNCGREVGTDG